MILHDPRNPKATAYRAEVEARLEGELPDGLTVVIGGDGFMLRTVRTHGLGHTYLGLNAGHLGFLLNDITDWDHMVSRIKAGDWEAYEFPLLEGHFELADGGHAVEQAINDIYLERASGQTAHLAISIDGHELVETLVADGVVFSTALGSTAYNFSAGGMACHPTLSLLAVTPICPHHPRLSPFALPGGTLARVDVRSPERRPVRGVADGRAVDQVVGVDIAISKQHVRLAYLSDHDFTAQMVSKILHP